MIIRNIVKVVPEDNPAIEPLVAALNNIVNAGDRTDMTDFQVKSNKMFYKIGESFILTELSLVNNILMSK